MEFLIRRSDGDFVELPEGADSCAVFQAPGFSTRLVEGLDVCAVEFKHAVLTFSMEMPGIQVALQSGRLAEEEMRAYVEALARALEVGTSQRLEVV